MNDPRTSDRPAIGHLAPASDDPVPGDPAQSGPAPSHPASGHLASGHSASGHPAPGHPAPGHLAAGYPGADRPAAIDLPRFLVLMESHHPFSAVLGIRMEAIGHGTARAILPENPAHQRLGGIVAGPMLMALADVALYAAVVGATGNSEAVTASLTINFLRKCPAGEVVAEARLLKTGRLCAGEVLLSPHGGAPVAQVVSTWALPGR